ncbi:MAG: glycosyltransferase family 4 protein [Gammaproteobacteria bacterium]
MKALWITSHEDSLSSIRPEAETLLGLARAGVECEIMTQGSSAYREPMEQEGIRVIDYVPKHKFDREAVNFIRGELVAGKHDILHLFNNKAIANGIMAARKLPVKVISYRGQTGNVHRYDPVCWLTHLSPRIDRVIAVANAVRDDLRTVRSDPQNVVTVYKGHDLDWYRDAPADLSEFGIPRGAFAVGAVANYRPRKGIEVLIQATHHLPPSAPVHLLLVGAGMDKPKLARLIEESPMRERIHVAGYRSDAAALIAACDASVLASIKREGLPKTVIEAMVHGVPAVVTDTGGSAELVVDGRTGLVVPPADAPALARAIQYLCEHPAEASAMGRLGRDRIDQDFNIRETIRQTLSVYEDALADRAPH